MKKFEGGEKFIPQMNKAFEKIENDEEDSDDDGDDENSASANRWKFDIALKVFQLFQFRCKIDRIPVQQFPQQALPQQPLQPSRQQPETPSQMPPPNNKK